MIRSEIIICSVCLLVLCLSCSSQYNKEERTLPQQNKDSSIFYCKQGMEKLQNSALGLPYSDGSDVMYKKTESARKEAIADFTVGIEFDSSSICNHLQRAIGYTGLAYTHPENKDYQSMMFKLALKDYDAIVLIDSADLTNYRMRGYFYLDQLKDTVKACNDFKNVYDKDSAEIDSLLRKRCKFN